jgi:hypothetical protein
MRDSAVNVCVKLAWKRRENAFAMRFHASRDQFGPESIF